MVAPADANWGASFKLVAGFAGHVALVSSSRQVIAELCAAYLDPTDRTAALVMATQELLENLAKYSLAADASFEFSLAQEAGVPPSLLVPLLEEAVGADEQQLARAELEAVGRRPSDALDAEQRATAVVFTGGARLA